MYRAYSALLLVDAYYHGLNPRLQNDSSLRHCEMVIGKIPNSIFLYFKFFICLRSVIAIGLWPNLTNLTLA